MFSYRFIYHGLNQLLQWFVWVFAWVFTVFTGFPCFPWVSLHRNELRFQAVSQSWKQRLQQAEKMCAGSSGDLMAQAKSACCAWGDVLMLERECCNVPGPPYCVNKGDSKLGHASATRRHSL